jgi:hypothetical protein
VSALVSPVTILAQTTRSSVHRIRARIQRRYRAWKQLFRPCAIELISLAIFLTLWGYSYKLSQYHLQSPSTPKIPVARLWIEQRNAYIVAASCLNYRSHLIPVSQVFLYPTQRFPHRTLTVNFIFPEFRRGITYFDYLIPFRSPPTQHFSLA